jgi:hypothetical protein
VFSSGGYSAQYGQALSSVLLLESIDLPEQTSASLGISSVGLSAGIRSWRRTKSGAGARVTTTPTCCRTLRLLSKNPITSRFLSSIIPILISEQKLPKQEC